MSKIEDDIVNAIIEIADKKPGNILGAAQIIMRHCKDNIKSVTLKGHVGIRKDNQR